MRYVCLTLDCVLTWPLANRECVDNLIFVEFLVLRRSRRMGTRWAEVTHYFLPTCQITLPIHPPTCISTDWTFHLLHQFNSESDVCRFCQERWENWLRSFNPIPTFQDQLLQKTQSDFLEVGWAGADCLIEPSWDEDKKAAVDIISSSQEQVAHPKNI